MSANPKSVYVVSVKFIQGKIKYPSILKSETISYYSDLKSASLSLRFKGQQWYNQSDFSFRIFEIDEYVMGKLFDEERQVRLYDTEGKLHGKYQWFKAFNGRDKKDCKFNLGDIVEFIDGTHLNLGIINALPPDKKTVSEIKRRYNGSVNLDSGEDCYRLISVYGGHEQSSSHECFIFPLSGKIDEKVKRILRKK